MTFANNWIALSELAAPLALDIRRDVEISGVGKITTQRAGRLVPVTSAHYLDEALAEQGIAALVVPAALADAVPASLGLVVSDAPAPTAMAVHEALCARPDFYWSSFPSRIDPSAEIAVGVFVAPTDVVIGPRTRIGPNAVILPRTRLGADCDIGANVVIGGDAFESAPDATPARILRQAGGVRIGNNVTLQSGTTVSRPAFACFTEIADEVHVDVQVYIAHDCQIDRGVQIAGNASLLGRVRVGEGTFVGPNAAISNGVTIGKKCWVTIGATVTRDVPDGERVSGNFALPHRKWLDLIRKFR